MNRRPSLESLIETEAIGVESFHPGGLESTRELAERCWIGKDTRVLDVASGTGETACFLVDELGAQVTGVDLSDHLLRRAREKAAQRSLAIEFLKGDAHELEFPDNAFDAVISECTLCLLDKVTALREMVRVTKPGGRVGIHDVCWQADTPDRLKERLEKLEGESPETLQGWALLFERAGLVDIQVVDKPALMPKWLRSVRKALGLVGQLKVFSRVFRLWGVAGLAGVLQSENIFRSRYVGYGIIVGTKPVSPYASRLL
jgi:SAM-dependent methyltransferase